MTRIVVLDGHKYLQCMYTFRYLARAYGIPKVDRNGKFIRDPVTQKIQRWGSFADAAAAAAYVDLQTTRGKYSQARRIRDLKAIHVDMGLDSDVNVQMAPYIEPTRLGDSLDYQNLCPRMMPDPDQCFTVEDVEKKPPTVKSAKPSFYLHELKPNSPVHSEPLAKAEFDGRNYDRICLSTMGTKLSVILHRKPLNSDPEPVNQAVSELRGQESRGDYLVCNSQQALSSTPSTPSSTSSSQSASSGSKRKRSSKPSKKTSGPKPPSSARQTRSSKKRSISAVESSSESKRPTKKSKKAV